MRPGRFLVALLALSIPLARTARADDAGGVVDAGERDGTSEAAEAAASTQNAEGGFVTACDGALCDTTTGSECDVGAGAVPARDRRSRDVALPIATIVLATLAARSRRGASRLSLPRQ